MNTLATASGISGLSDGLNSGLHFGLQVANLRDRRKQQEEENRQREQDRIDRAEDRTMRREEFGLRKKALEADMARQDTKDKRDAQSWDWTVKERQKQDDLDEAFRQHAEAFQNEDAADPRDLYATNIRYAQERAAIADQFGRTDLAEKLRASAATWQTMAQRDTEKAEDRTLRHAQTRREMAEGYGKAVYEAAALARDGDITGAREVLNANALNDALTVDDIQIDPRSKSVILVRAGNGRKSTVLTEENLNAMAKRYGAATKVQSTTGLVALKKQYEDTLATAKMDGDGETAARAALAIDQLDAKIAEAAGMEMTGAPSASGGLIPNAKRAVEEAPSWLLCMGDSKERKRAKEFLQGLEGVLAPKQAQPATPLVRSPAPAAAQAATNAPAASTNGLTRTAAGVPSVTAKMVRVRAPNGDVATVPADKAEKYIGMGGTLLLD